MKVSFTSIEGMLISSGRHVATSIETGLEYIFTMIDLQNSLQSLHVIDTVLYIKILCYKKII